MTEWFRFYYPKTIMLHRKLGKLYHIDVQLCCKQMKLCTSRWGS